MNETSRDALLRQYQTSANPKARAALHERYSTTRYSWFRWIFNHFEWPPFAHVLELGCGPGDLWDKNRVRIPSGWQVLLTDLSGGMLWEAQQLLTGLAQFRFAVADAQAIPCLSAAFDIVVANQMLPHVPNLERALDEIYRVLRPGGYIYAATSGRGHMRELEELLQRFESAVDRRSLSSDHAFSLETAAGYLGGRFREVEISRYDDALVVPDAGPLVDYVYSLPPPRAPAPERRAAFAAFVERELDRGPLRIAKDLGVVMAVKPL